MSNNLHVNLALTAANAVNSLLSVDTNGGNTPRTPEIVNSLMAMTNPLDLDFCSARKKFHANNLSSDSNSSSSQESRTCTNGPTSVQQTCSQLIKAGLKLSIEQKRKHQSDSEDLLDLDKVKRIKKNESESEEDKCHNNNGLTPEDEERRRRRRERNKIAATKCRLKKRERTNNLVTEAESLETQNIDLKHQLQNLKTESRHLTDILSMHKPNCQKNVRPTVREPQPPTTTTAYSRLPPVHSVIEPNHSYNRPASVDNTYCTYNRPITYSRTPNIIVESVNDDDYQTSLTDLDNPTETYLYSNNQQCHNYPTNPTSYGSHGIDGCMA